MPERGDTVDIYIENLSEAMSGLISVVKDYAINVLAPVLQDISDKYDIKE